MCGREVLEFHAMKHTTAPADKLLLLFSLLPTEREHSGVAATVGPARPHPSCPRSVEKSPATSGKTQEAATLLSRIHNSSALGLLMQKLPAMPPFPVPPSCTHLPGLLVPS